MSVTLRKFCDATMEYHRQRERPRDKMGEPRYKTLVLATIDEPPQERVEGIISTLMAWSAFRNTEGNVVYRPKLRAWLEEYGNEVDHLRRTNLLSLTDSDYLTILTLAQSLREHGWRPTGYGKLLHFLALRSIVLWDTNVVRTLYDIDGDPLSFVEYQLFCRALLEALAVSGGKPTLEEVVELHSKARGAPEPLTKVIDELAYDGPTGQSFAEELHGVRGRAVDLLERIR